jgi:hypothetical protein
MLMDSAPLTSIFSWVLAQGVRIPDCLNYCGGLDFVK